MIRTSLLIALCLFSALAFIAACGGGEEGGPAGAELPEGFPSDFPIYEAVTVRVATLGPEGGRFLVSMESEDSADEVRAFYERELDAEPWQIENVQDIAELETTVIEFARRDSPGQSGTIAIAAVHVDGQRSSMDLELAAGP
jgi:hypothetical protein